MMDAELISLEEKLQQLVALCRNLREENRSLRQDLLQAQQDHQHVANKLAGTKERVATILAKLPEDMA
jgi:cell division protein ZapB